MSGKGWREKIQSQWEGLSLRLARPDAVLQLALLGIVTGVLSGAVIVCFRLLVEGGQDLLLPGSGSENYESLAVWQRLLLPVAGSLLLFLLFWRWGKGLSMLGVARVMERLAHHQGRMSLRELLLQFAGAGIAIASGHSVGREGPHIHLGASAGSLLGQRLQLPHNALATLVGCGVAAGIAASFNTPLAGVIFALEVVLTDYSLSSFVPVILAAVSATLVSNAVLGSQPAFVVPHFGLGSGAEILWVILLGLLIGTASAGFVRLLSAISAFGRERPLWLRLLVAGLGMGIIGALLPELMGIGYDSLNLALMAQAAPAMLLLLAVGKIVATSLCVGLGVPGGMIGPALFAGGALGSAIGVSAHGLLPELATQPQLFAMLGMGAMMSASLQAPLAALTAMLELTHNPEIILPGMLAVVVANLTARELFGTGSLFHALLDAVGMGVRHSPLIETLRRIGVAAVMDRSFANIPTLVERSEAEQRLAKSPRWLVITPAQGDPWLMPAADLAAQLKQPATDPQAPMDMLELPGRRYRLALVHLQQSLAEAWEILQQDQAEALLVRRMTAPGIWHLYGVLTREQIEAAYRG